MKYILLISLLLSSLYAAHIDEFASDMDYMRDYKAAVKKATKEHKMIMLVMVADYCPWCRKFERKTLKSANIAIRIEKNFIAVIMDRNVDKKRYPDEFYTPLIPNVFFIDPKESDSYLHDSIGYVGKQEYAASIEEALLIYEKEGK